MLVRIVDECRVISVTRKAVRSCPSEFLTLPAQAFVCHLEDGLGIFEHLLTEDLLNDVQNSLPKNQVVDLVSKGPVVERIFKDDGFEFQMLSIPVDLEWQSPSSSCPFSPKMFTVNTMKESFFSVLGINSSDICISLQDALTAQNDNLSDSILNDNEFGFVNPLEKSSSFHWLPPELPRKDTFSARGIVVDTSGQIYIQVSSQRTIVKGLKKLLNEKFSESCPDVDQTPLSEGQECCVRWIDDSWYRARFLRYNDQSKSEAHVLLVDYGNVFKANCKEDLRRTIYAEKIPIQSLIIELANVIPLGPNGTWEHSVLDLMQDLTNCERFEDRSNRLKIKIVGKMDKLPLKAQIQFETDDKSKVDLATFLLHHGHILISDTVHRSEDFNDLRNQWTFGIQAVPSGTYPEKNFYLLLQDNCDEVKVENQTLNYIDWASSGLKICDLLTIEVVEVVDSKTVFLHPAKNCNEYLVKLFNDFEQTQDDVQFECGNNPPVFQPTTGLLVCGNFEGGWYRAIVTNYTEDDINLDFIDYGNKIRITDSLKVKQIPERFISLPVMAIRLQLDLECLEEEDIVHTLLLEYVSTCSQTIGVKISSFRENGQLTGHLVDCSTGKYVYQGLVEEKIIKLL